MADDIESFPRGGERVGKQEIHKDKSSGDLLFGNDDPSKSQTHRNKTKDIKGKKKSEKVIPGKVLAKKVFTENFSFKYLRKGFLLLGYIKEISLTDVVVGLPNGLNGHITILALKEHLEQCVDGNSDIDSDAETESSQTDIASLENLLNIGQLLPIAVKALYSEKHGYKKIELSPFPTDVNIGVTSKCITENMLIWGVVQSIEDHGFIISYGPKENVGFVPKSKVKEKLFIGMFRWFFVKKVSSNGKIVTFSLDVNSKRTDIDHDKIHFNSFIPGQLVKFKVVEVSTNLISGKIFGSFDGIINTMHFSDNMLTDSDMKGKKLAARILHINPHTKQIGLSCLENVMDFLPDIISKTYDIGDIIKDAVVTKADNKMGLFFKMPDLETAGNVHISRVSDEHIEKLNSNKKYKVGSKHKCRVLGYSALDSLYTLSMLESDLSKEFMRFDDLKAGMIVSGTIITLEKFGCLVKITSHIRALLPRIHLADIILNHPEKKFVAGKNIKVRVLSVEPKEKKLLVTHKKTLVNSELPIVTNYQDVKPLSVVVGFVSGVKAFGVFVTFYNGVHGLLPKSEIVASQGPSWEENYFVGKVLQCTVASSTHNQITLSLKNPEDIQSSSVSLQVGQVVQGTYVEVDNDQKIIIKAGCKNVILPINYVSDFKSLNDQWEAVLNSDVEEYVFKDLLVTGWDKDKKKNICSGKQVYRIGDNHLKTFSDLKVDHVYGGVVAVIMPFGIFVELTKGVTGLVPLAKIADQFVSDAKQTHYVGQSVLVKVIEVDEKKKRFLGTTKVSVLQNETDSVLNVMLSDTNLLETFLIQRRKLHDVAEKSKDMIIRTLPSYVGEVLIVKVVGVQRDSVQVEYYDENASVKVSGSVPTTLKYEQDCEVGCEIQVLVLDVNLKEFTFMGTAHPDVIKSAIKSTKRSKKPNFSAEQKVDGIINIVTNDFTLLHLPGQHNTVAYMPGRRHLNDCQHGDKKYAPNQKVTVIYEKTTAHGILVKDVDQRLSDSKDVVVGAVVTSVVKGVKPCQLSVTLLNGRINGYIHVSQILDSIVEGESPLKAYKPAQTVVAKVIGLRDLKTHNYLPISHTNISKSIVELSTKPSVIAALDFKEPFPEKTLTDYKIGDTVRCYVVSLTKTFVYVAVTPTIKGRIYCLHLANEVEEVKHWHSTFKPGVAYFATVFGYSEEHKCLDLSRIGLPHKSVTKNSIVTGKITKIIKNVGLLITLPDQKAGIAHVTEINTTFTEDPLKKFSVNSFVSCQILSVEAEDKINLSLRESRLSGSSGVDDADRALNGFDDIKEGDILRGYIKTCSKSGVFISLSAKIIGRVQIKNISQYYVKDYESLCVVGKLVKVKVLSINPKNNQIDLSMRGKDVGDVDLAPPPKRKSIDDKDDYQGDQGKKKQRTNGEDSHENENTDEDLATSEDSSSEDENEEMTQEDEGEEGDAKPTLKLGESFDWSVEQKEHSDVDTSDDNDSEDDENEKAQARKTKRQKRAAKKAEEESLHKAELALLDTERQLESSEDFDRVILGSPNSSILWIQYMAFHLHMAEVDKARLVAERALKTISFREEQEKLNVWVALLNLESMYGSEESLQHTLKEAVKLNDFKKIYLKMVEIYTKNKKLESAEKLYQDMLKKRSTKSSKKVWVGFAYFLARQGEVERARKLLTEGLKSIPQRKHIETIVQFAILEFKVGEYQRGATIFESILKNYPRRTDLWSIYIDMNIKVMNSSGQEKAVEQVRNIFERVITMKLNSKKMKFFFKRYLDFEDRYGNKSTIDGVRQKAERYVEDTSMDQD